MLFATTVDLQFIKRGKPYDFQSGEEYYEGKSSLSIHEGRTGNGWRVKIIRKDRY